MKITLALDMVIPNGADGWTLQEAIESIKAQGMTRLLERNDEIISEQIYQFESSIRDGKSPTNGQVLAAYYVVAINTLDDEYYADDSEMTSRQYAGKQAAITKTVFRKTRKA